MGSFSSGRPQTKKRVEETPRVDALEYAHANGLPIIERNMPDGAPFELGTCPECQQARRDLYTVENVVKCRECHDLIYTRDSQSNSHAARIVADPRASGEALAQMSEFVETGEPSKYNGAMRTLCALDRLPTASSATDALKSELAERILTDDLNGATGLLEIIKAQIMEGVENTTNRRGETLEIAMRSDTIAKLARAYVIVAGFRAQRAGEMLDLIAANATPEERKSFADEIRETMEATNYKFPSGHTLDELREARAKPQGAATPDKPKI